LLALVETDRAAEDGEVFKLVDIDRLAGYRVRIGDGYEKGNASHV